MKSQYFSGFQGFLKQRLYQVKRVQYFQVGMSLASKTTSSGTRFSLKKGPKVTVTSRDFHLLTGALHVHQHGAHVGATWPVARLVERTNKVMGVDSLRDQRRNIQWEKSTMKMYPSQPC